MTYKAYIDNIKAQTGKGPEQYLAMAKRKGLTTHSELLAWLKTEMGLGHGHANAIILYIRDPKLGKRKISEDATLTLAPSFHWRARCLFGMAGTNGRTTSG